MRRCMKKSHRLKVRRDAACLIDLNEFLDFFSGVTMAEKMSKTELNNILLNSMPRN